MKERFCPECGTKVASGETFCPNCGHKLVELTAVDHEEKTTSSATNNPDSSQAADSSMQRSNTAPQPQQPLDKRVIWAIIAVVVILVRGYFGLKNYYQPQNQLNRIITAMGNPDQNLAKYVKTNDPTLEKKISEKNLKPTQKYFADNRQELADLKSSLQDGTTFENTYSLEQTGNAWLLFPRYKINIEAAYVTLSTNHAGVTFLQDGKKIAKTTNMNHSKKVGPLFPGKYKFKATGKIAGRSLSNTSTYTLAAGEQALPLKLKTANFTITGNQGATVYLNNKNVGKLNDQGKMKFKEYPISNDLKVYITIPVAGKNLKSKTVDVNSKLEYGSHTISPGFKGVASKDDAQELLQEAFSGAESGDDDSSTAELFTGEESNSSYNDLLKFFDSFNTNDNIETYDAEISKINSVTPAGKNKATVSYSIKYTFNNTSDNGESRKVQQFTYPNAIIVKQGDDYKIQTVGTTKAADWEKNYSDDD